MSTEEVEQVLESREVALEGFLGEVSSHILEGDSEPTLQCVIGMGLASQSLGSW